MPGYLSRLGTRSSTLVRSVLLSSVFAVLASVCFVTATFAGDNGPGWDYKSAPGAACQAQIGAQAGDLERYPHSIRNNEQELPRTIICPIVRDSNKPSKLDIAVTVSTGVTCMFHSMNGSGDAVVEPKPPVEVVAIDDRETQYFGVLGSEVTALDGYYALQCTLPANLEVFGYRWGELTDSTDYGN